MGNHNCFKGVVKNIFLLAFIAGILSFNMAFAADEQAILSGIEIKPSENGSYEVVLDTSKTVPLKTESKSRNRLELSLKGIKPAGSVNTIYGDGSNVDLVLVKPQNDNVRIFIEGKNIGSSTVSFNAENAPLKLDEETPENTMILDGPLDAYTPVFQDEEKQDGFISDDIYSLGIQNFIKQTFNKSNFGWFLSIVLMALFSYSMIRANREKDEEEISIPLALNRANENLKQRDVELYSELNKASSIIEERAKVRQNSSYGLREYQNSQINPNPNAGFNKITRETAAPQRPSVNNNQDIFKTKAQKAPVAASSVKPRQATASVSKQDTKKAELNMNNIKFLEAMTHIYEKSGRVDLANNLQSKLTQKRIMAKKI